MGYWECNNCGEDKCTRSGEFLQPINCTMYSWRKPKWKEVRKTPNTKESSNSIDNKTQPIIDLLNSVLLYLDGEALPTEENLRQRINGRIAQLRADA